MRLPIASSGPVAACLALCSLTAGCQGDDPAASPPSNSPIDLLQTGSGRDGLIGWNIMSPEYLEPSDIDGISFEWDYFMVHASDGAFTGSVGYLFANPRNVSGLGDLLPKGGNAAVAGLFKDGGRAADYRNFGIDGSSISGTERRFDAQGDGDGQFAKMTPERAAVAGEPDSLHLEGKTDAFAWDLRVVQDWPALSASGSVFAPMRGDDVGSLLTDENWNVNMLWPRTRIDGAVTRLGTGEQIAVSGHGYRENSWGRWAFNMGGWDFGVVSDEASGVSWAWQSYHKKSVALDYVDVGFVDDGAVKLEQFRASNGEVGWSHPSWTFDAEARLCVPLTTHVEAQNAEYRIVADLDLKDRQVPMLSDATSATKQYVIMIQFPLVSGTITRRSDGVQVAAFSGQGGGELSNARSQATSMTDAECNEWGAAFASPMP